MVIPVGSIDRRRGGRVPMVAGNWKMNTSLDEALELVEELIEPLDQLDGVERVICPPAIWLPLIYESIEGTGIRLGAQTMHWAERGAYTGELSPTMLAEFCDLVIIGHSERRQHFGESDEAVNRKVKAAVAHELVPIICVGEALAEREAGQTLERIGGQLAAALDGLPPDQVAELVVAYEPIWAIGTGRAATPDDAGEAIGHLRRLVVEQHGPLAGAGLRILYGGSVTGASITELMARPEIDGALVGGASLNAVDFVRIAELAARARA